jgi:hypothetical protein
VPSTPKPTPLVVPMTNAHTIAVQRSARPPLRTRQARSFQRKNVAMPAGIANTMAIVAGAQSAATIA